MKHLFFWINILNRQVTMEDTKIIFGIIMNECILGESFTKKRLIGYKIRCF
jgi:hypothetical protein